MGHPGADLLGRQTREWRLRKMRAEEADLGHQILVSAADRLMAKGIRQWTTAYPKSDYLASQAHGWNYALVRDDQIAVIMTLAWVTPFEWPDHFGASPVWWLSKLATAPGYRGRGLGALAVRRAIRMLTDQHADRLCHDCVQGQGFLVTFYQGLGFRVLDRREVRFSTGIFDMVLMDLTLRHAAVPPSWGRPTLESHPEAL